MVFDAKCAERCGGESGPEYRVAGHKTERKMGKASLEYRGVCNRYKGCDSQVPGRGKMFVLTIAGKDGKFGNKSIALTINVGNIAIYYIYCKKTHLIFYLCIYLCRVCVHVLLMSVAKSYFFLSMEKNNKIILIFFF